MNILLASILARVLTPPEFGQYILAFTVVTFGSIVAMLGLEKTLIRLVADRIVRGRPADALGAVKASKRMTTGVTAALVIAIIAGRDVLFGQWLNSPGLVKAVGWIALWIGLQALNALHVAVLRGAHKLVIASVLDGFVRSAALLILVLGLVFADAASLSNVLAGAVASMAISVAAGSIAVRRWWVTDFSDVNGDANVGGVSIRDLWRQSWPLMTSTILAFAITQADLWFVGAFASADDVAIYGAITRLMFLVTLPLVVVNATVSSTVAELFAERKTGLLQDVLRATATLAAFATTLIVIALLAAGERVLTVLFGTFYASGVQLLAILFVGRMINVWTGSCGITLMMTGHQRSQFVVTALSVMSLVFGAVWAGPRFGVVGIAVVYSVNMLLNNIVMLLVVRWKVGVWTNTFISPRRFVRALRQFGTAAPANAVTWTGKGFLR